MAQILYQITQKKIDNPFWQDVFNSWPFLRKKTNVRTWEDYLSQPIWVNLVKVGGKTICYKTLQTNGILFISDLVIDNGTFFNYQYLRDSAYKHKFSELTWAYPNVT